MKKNRKTKYSERKLNILIVGIFGIGIGVFLVLVINILTTTNIDEDDFCKKKINEWYPEHNYDKIYYLDDGMCIGEYKKSNKILISERDGLMEYIPPQSETKKIYQLTNKSDINYLASEDYTEWFAIGAIFLFICYVFYRELI